MGMAIGRVRPIDAPGRNCRRKVELHAGKSCSSGLGGEVGGVALEHRVERISRGVVMVNAAGGAPALQWFGDAFDGVLGDDVAS